MVFTQLTLCVRIGDLSPPTPRQLASPTVLRQEPRHRPLCSHPVNPGHCGLSLVCHAAASLVPRLGGKGQGAGAWNMDGKRSMTVCEVL